SPGGWPLQRAFKRWSGQPPGEYRRTQRQAG
ncbi:MAG: AraC family transcriptional regulator, partial [Pseudomonas monteilii]